MSLSIRRKYYVSTNTTAKHLYRQVLQRVGYYSFFSFFLLSGFNLTCLKIRWFQPTRRSGLTPCFYVTAARYACSGCVRAVSPLPCALRCAAGQMRADRPEPPVVPDLLLLLLSGTERILRERQTRQSPNDAIIQRPTRPGGGRGEDGWDVAAVSDRALGDLHARRCARSAL